MDSVVQHMDNWELAVKISNLLTWLNNILTISNDFINLILKGSWQYFMTEQENDVFNGQSKVVNNNN